MMIGLNLKQSSINSTMLTHKAEQDFNSWKDKPLGYQIWPSVTRNVWITEWFDSVGIYIDPITYITGKMVTHYGIAINGVECDVKEQSKQAAIEKGIELANDIYNNNIEFETTKEQNKIPSLNVNKEVYEGAISNDIPEIIEKIKRDQAIENYYNRLKRFFTIRF